MEIRGTAKGRIHPYQGNPVKRTDDQVLAEKFARNFEIMARGKGEFVASALKHCGIDPIRFDAMKRGDIRCPVTFGDLLAATGHFGARIEEFAS